MCRLQVHVMGVLNLKEYLYANEQLLHQLQSVYMRAHTDGSIAWCCTASEGLEGAPSVHIAHHRESAQEPRGRRSSPITVQVHAAHRMCLPRCEIWCRQHKVAL